jgi:hypothetical protein
MKDQIQTLNRQYESITWGALFILVGILSLVPGIPPGAGTLGIGVILLGLNLVRSFSHIPTNGFTLTLGLVAAILGAAVLIGSLQGFQLEGPFFPALLIAIGVYWLLPERKGQ